MEEVKESLVICQKKVKIKNAFLEYSIIRSNYNNYDNKAFDIIRRYINQYYSENYLETINQRVFEYFYISYLPTMLLNIRIKDIEDLKTEWSGFLEFISKEYNTQDYTSLNEEIYNKKQEELLRLRYLIKSIRKYGEVPVLSWDPFIVDINCYKNMKNSENSIIKYIMHEQGYFSVHDKISNILILKKLGPSDSYYKIKIDSLLLKDMDIGDIIQMSIKRKVFCSSWNIINVKAYFSKSASRYLHLGGKR